METQFDLIPPAEDYQIPVALLDALSHGRLPHAVLLVGPAAATKRAARYMAKVLLCNSAVRPCGECEACVKFEAEAQADYFEIGGASVKTADVGNLQNWVPVRAHHGRKVYALFAADTMTGVAANRLLKTLEEPVSTIYAILTAVSSQSVLSTIRSRCFTYTIHYTGSFIGSDHSVAPLLQSATHPEENSMFDGFVDKMIRWSQMWLVDKQPALILAARWQSIIGEIPPDDSLTLLAEWLRDILHTRIGQHQIRFSDWAEELARISPILEVKQWTKAIDIVLESRQRLQSHVAALLNFEQMCIRLREVLADV